VTGVQTCALPIYDHQFVEPDLALHLDPRRLSHGAKDGGRLAALSFGYANTDLRILDVFGVSRSDVLLQCFFSPTLCRNRPFQKRQGTDIPVAIDLDHGTEIGLSKHSNVDHV